MLLARGFSRRAANSGLIFLASKLICRDFNRFIIEKSLRYTEELGKGL